MLTMVLQLLLPSGNETLEDWILTVIWWIPQVIWIAIATALLVGVMRGLRRYWIRWVFMWVPYAMLGGAVYQALGSAYWNYKLDNPFTLIAHNSLLRAYWAPTFLAVPFLLVLHVILFRKQAQREAPIRN
ncbi:hypothetical protein [Hymenobacter defluvii]|uniref:Uncharacterized protein n=1 Tax=Hymenobacter defluvii TaxID=2054411 RepID=A0ABS3TGB6_9BACT|nr:hypothetical protein [Hymenobacter defluvii]MBO3272233.1 hypothetical protein [Hymenobacter defluvii]